MNPKSDQQRKRLAESIKSILLFRSLDGVSFFESLNLKKIDLKLLISIIHNLFVARSM